MEGDNWQALAYKAVLRVLVKRTDRTYHKNTRVR